MADTDFEFGGMKISRDSRRLFVTAELEPSNGDPRIQPTGFPDVGPVLYPDPSGENSQICLIESEPSMANRLEEVCLADKYTGKLASGLSGLPYIEVWGKDGTFQTASTIDSHRFASSHLMLGCQGKIATHREQQLVDYVKDGLGSRDGKNVAAAKVPIMYKLAMELDPMALIHGFQISLKQHFTFVGCRSPRALVGCIVGLGSEPLGVPGVRVDPLEPEEGQAGQAIFRKERVVSKRIEARFSIDLGLLWGLPVAGVPADDEEEEDRPRLEGERAGLQRKRADLLVALSLWKIARLLKEFHGCYRLRTECDLTLKTEKATYKLGARSTGQDFPFAAIAEATLKARIEGAAFPAGRSPLKLTVKG